jgi:hypothetical protein
MIIATLSRFVDHLVPFCESVRASGYKGLIVVADDGIEDKLRASGPLAFIPCPRPFNFARNANMILRAFPQEDVFLVNDDAVLRTTSEGLDLLASAAHYADSGIVSAGLTGHVYNPLQATGEFRSLGDSDVAFVAVLLSAELRRKIGLLDEGYDGYGYEDNDYSARARAAGLANVCEGRCVVDHPEPSSSFKRVMTPEEYAAAVARNLRRWETSLEDNAKGRRHGY